MYEIETIEGSEVDSVIEYAIVSETCHSMGPLRVATVPARDIGDLNMARAISKLPDIIDSLKWVQTTYGHDWPKDCHLNELINSLD